MKKYLIALALLFNVAFSQEVDSLLNAGSASYTVTHPYLVSDQMYTLVYDDYEATFITYVEYKHESDSVFTSILVNISDYMDVLSILDNILDTGMYQIKIYLRHDINPLTKGTIFYEDRYAVLEKNQ
jgi:hypothetical protein